MIVDFILASLQVNLLQFPSRIQGIAGLEIQDFIIYNSRNQYFFVPVSQAQIPTRLHAEDSVTLHTQ